MKIEYGDAVVDALEHAPAGVRKAFFKQIKILEQNLRHPSLRAKKYDEANESVAGSSESGLEILFSYRR